MKEFCTARWQRLKIMLIYYPLNTALMILLALLVSAIIMYGLPTLFEYVTSPRTPEHLKALESPLTFLQTLVFLATGVAVFLQLRQVAEQQRLYRLVSWKNSTQNICEAIVNKPDLYLPLLYPPEKVQSGEAARMVAVFDSMHSLETIYFMRKHEEVPPKELRRFVEAFITASDDFREFWENKAFRPAFTLEFQKEVNRILRLPPQATAPQKDAAGEHAT